MALKLYDEALINKIKNWCKSTDLHIYSPDDTRMLFEVIADSTNDKPIQLPIICLRRQSSIQVMSNRQPLSYDGLSYKSNYEKTIQINAIPITLEYQIDIYTRYMEEADEYVRNILFNIVNFPKLPVIIPYQDINIEHDSAIRINGDIQDNSSIPERLVHGQFTRYSLNIIVDDAYMWDVRTRTNIHIEDGLVED